MSLKVSESALPRLAELAKELATILNNPPARPTKDDRKKLVVIREQIKKLPEELKLSPVDERDQRYLYVIATKEANRQEDFFESNGNKWAE